MAQNAAIDRIRQHRARPRIVGLEVEDGEDPASPGDSPEMQSVEGNASAPSDLFGFVVYG